MTSPQPRCFIPKEGERRVVGVRTSRYQQPRGSRETLWVSIHRLRLRPNSLYFNVLPNWRTLNAISNGMEMELMMLTGTRWTSVWRNRLSGSSESAWRRVTHERLLPFVIPLHGRDWEDLTAYVRGPQRTKYRPEDVSHSFTVWGDEFFSLWMPLKHVCACTCTGETSHLQSECLMVYLIHLSSIFNNTEASLVK